MESVNTWEQTRDGQVPPAAFRQALGRFGSGVTVVSVPHADGYHAMTANAFMSISLEPPLVAVSVGRKARINEHLRVGTRLGISVLSQMQQAIGLHFGGRPDAALRVELCHALGIPLVANSAAHFVAEVDALHEAGDHRIFVLRLLLLQWTDAPPLLFWGGRFGEFEACKPAHAGPAIAPDFWC